MAAPCEKKFYRIYWTFFGLFGVYPGHFGSILDMIPKSELKKSPIFVNLKSLWEIVMEFLTVFRLTVSIF